MYNNLMKIPTQMGEHLGSFAELFLKQRRNTGL